MLTYAMIQELATQKFYTMAAKRTESPFLRRLWSLIAADEMRHHVFYREHLQGAYQAAADQPWYSTRSTPPRARSRCRTSSTGCRARSSTTTSASASRCSPQLARCFAFDLELLGRLAADRQSF